MSRGKRNVALNKRAAHLEKVADRLDIPKEFLAGTPLIKIVGDGEFTLEGELSVIEYTEEILRINTRNFILTLTGKNFEVTEMLSDYIKCTGEIDSLSYLK